MEFDDLLKSRKVIVCCGSGGVGKTTLSAAIGVRAASLGIKVLVLTIDPARRLANALGFEKFDADERRVDLPGYPGELYASMLDMKKIFDELITKLAQNGALVQRILDNRVYQQLSTALSGSQEYTAIEKLLQVYSSKKFDLIILDTPPSHHAMDFFNAPEKIYSLFQESVMRWFVAPMSTLNKFSFGLLNRSTKAAFKALEKITGADFLVSLTDFFGDIQQWQGVFRERNARVHRLLTSDETGFLLVTGYSKARLEEARNFERQLTKLGHQLQGIIVNRIVPVQEEIPLNALENASAASQKLLKYYNQLQAFFTSQREAFRMFASEPRDNVLFIRVPDLDQDVHDVATLKRIADRLSHQEAL